MPVMIANSVGQVQGDTYHESRPLIIEDLQGNKYESPYPLEMRRHEAACKAHGRHLACGLPNNLCRCKKVA